MPIIPFGEFVPDAAPLGNPGSVRIVNAVPGPTSYKPFPQLAALTNSLDARPRGAIAASDKDLNTYLYAGDAAKLYSLTGTEWADASKVDGYSTGTDESWEFVRWKNKILATNFSDSPQQITMGAAAFEDLTDGFRARHIAVVGDYVVAANTFDATDGAVPDRVRWSAFNDETDWTVSPSTGSDFRDLNAGGKIQRVIGGEFGVIISERSTWRMSFSGAPTFFQIAEVLPGVGTIAPGSVTRLGSTVYFLSEQGFVALTNGTSDAYPGAGRVDQFILRDIDRAHLNRVSSVADPKGGRIAWAYPGSGNTGGRPNRIVIYDRVLNRWSLIEQDVELIWRASGVGFTLEELDGVSATLEGLDVSLDSSQWKGGTPEFAAFNSSFSHGFFNGPPMTATIETKEVEIAAGFITQLNAFRSLVDGGTVTARVGTRGKQSGDISFGPVLHERDTGRFTTRARSRYHQFRIIISGDWRDAIGIQIEPQEARRAGRRA